MTVGEKIQLYRKNLGMSQEDLGQKLLVSRQTISQWEKDQTVPTIDNLMRLKEVFGVSVDDILNTETEELAVNVAPVENYVFNFSITELDGIFRMQRKSIWKRPIITAIICIMAVIPAVISTEPQVGLWFFAGVFIVNLLVFLKELRRYDKFCKNTIPRVAGSTYEYQLYSDYININIYQNDEKTRQIKCYYKDIEKVYRYGSWLFFQISGQSYIVRQENLKENSIFYSYMFKIFDKTVVNQTPAKLRTVSIVLFIASLLSIVAGMNLLFVMSEINGLFVENIWVLFLFTPITVASVVFGFILKSKGYKYKKNVIAGIIMTVVLCIYGSFAFIFAGMYDHSDTPVIETEQTIGIDIPKYTSISTEDMSQWSQRPSGERTLCKSEITFNNSQSEEFEKQIKTDERWLSSVPNDLIGVMTWYRDFTVYDYALIYNTDTAEFNSLPQNEGTYHFINILYSSEGDRMIIIEYEIDFVK